MEPTEPCANAETVIAVTVPEDADIHPRDLAGRDIDHLPAANDQIEHLVIRAASTSA